MISSVTQVLLAFLFTVSCVFFGAVLGHGCATATPISLSVIDKCNSSCELNSGVKSIHHIINTCFCNNGAKFYIKD